MAFFLFSLINYYDGLLFSVDTSCLNELACYVIDSIWRCWRKGESFIRHPAWFLFQKSSFQPNFIWHLCTHHVLSHKYSIHLSFIHAVNLHHTIINLLVGRFKATLHPLFYILQSHKNRSELIFTRHIRASNSQQQKKRQCNNNEMCSGTMTINTETDRTKTTKEMPHIFRLITFRYHIDVNYDWNTESLKRISLIWSWERERERKRARRIVLWFRMQGVTSDPNTGLVLRWKHFLLEKRRVLYSLLA